MSITEQRAKDDFRCRSRGASVIDEHSGPTHGRMATSEVDGEAAHCDCHSLRADAHVPPRDGGVIDTQVHHPTGAGNDDFRCRSMGASVVNTQVQHTDAWPRER